MSRADFLCINGHKLFKQLSKTVGTTCNKTLNIITERQNVLYAWNKEDGSVLTLNIKAARENEESASNYQTLLPHSPPYFTPERLIVNETNTILIAAGPNGVLVFELPDRTPPYGNFANNKEVIFCRSYSLLDNILSFSSTVECRQVRFHPGSPTDSHFVVLTSDNVIRLFSLENSAISERFSYSLGPKPSGKIPDRNLSFLDILGDLAVDFDFSSPTIEKVDHPKHQPSYKIGKGDGESSDEVQNDLLIWSIFILYGNGLICKMTISYNGEKCHPGLYGPLNFKKFPAGNLSDFCSIVCIPTTPPIVAIAHCDGNLYHGLELPCDEEDIKKLTQNETQQDAKPIYCKSAITDLYLFEVIEVELGLSISNSNVDAKNYTCPIFLERDLGKLGSYFASHNTGVHSINISAVEDLNQFLIKEDQDSLSEEIFTRPSTAEYLICTKTASTEKLNPVLGISIVNEPHAIITFFANGNVVTLAIKDDFRTVPIIPDKLEDTETDTENLNLSRSLLSQTTPFDVYINNILKQSTSQPILQVDTKNAEPTQEVCYEVLQRASKIFRDEHFVNLTKAREEMQRRSKQLKVLQEFQISELNNLNKERQTLQTNAENIAEKYEDLKEKQEEITKRCQMMLIMLSRKQTEPSVEEQKYFEKLKMFDKRIDGFIVALEKLKDKMKYQRNQMINWKKENRRPEQLFPGQSDTIRQNLADTTKKMAEITTEVKEYMIKLNIR